MTSSISSPRRPSTRPALPGSSDPRTVFAGAAGLLAVLARVDPRSAAVDALLGRIHADPPAGPVLPGLYTGVAGIAWVGYDVARLRGDDPGLALALARQIPTDWHLPDVVHGLAGAGLAFAHLWQQGAGEEFRDRVRACADALTKSAVDTPYGLMWPFPVDADSGLAGRAAYGFAHGVAGIGTFLLTAGQVTGEARYRDLAVRAAQTLAANVQGDAANAWWYADPEEQEIGGYPVSAAHWCNGASGAGTFLLRLGQATGDPMWTDLARRADDRAPGGPRGDGLLLPRAGRHADFLLDLADSLGEQRYRDSASELARLIAATAARRTAGSSSADDTRNTVTPASPPVRRGPRRSSTAWCTVAGAGGCPVSRGVHGPRTGTTNLRRGSPRRPKDLEGGGHMIKNLRRSSS